MDTTEVTYCGLYCGLCASRRRIPKLAAALLDALAKEGYDFWYADVPEFKDRWVPFREVVAHLMEEPCPGCRAGGGYPPCPVRASARERNVTTCAECAEWPCDKSAFLKRYPTLAADVARLREIGLERWATEQEARAATGFCYADIRYRESTAG